MLVLLARFNRACSRDNCCGFRVEGTSYFEVLVGRGFLNIHMSWLALGLEMGRVIWKGRNMWAWEGVHMVWFGLGDGLAG
jgi:hypothetical protein